VEPIKEAVTKARASLDRPSPREHRELPTSIGAGRVAISAHKVQPAWAPPQVALDETHLTRNRIISFAAKDPAHIAFNQLRTRLLEGLQGPWLEKRGGHLAFARLRERPWWR